MFEERYGRSISMVQEMAKRIAENGPQIYATTEAFVEVYGSEAAEMASKGGLLAALYEFGINAVPASFEGATGHQPRGLKLEIIREAA